MRIKPVATTNKRMLSFIPLKHVIISTSLSPDDALLLFSDSVSPGFGYDWLATSPNLKRIQGNVFKERFTIAMIDNIGRGGMSMVSLSGKFIPAMDRVKINMYVYPTMPLMMIPFGIIAVMIGVLFLPEQNMGYFNIFWITCGIFIIFIYTIGYFVEVDQLGREISNLLGKHLIEKQEDHL